MSAGSRVLVLAIPATVLTHSSPAMLAVLAVLAVYDPVELSQAGAIRHKLYTVFYLLAWPGLAWPAGNILEKHLNWTGLGQRESTRIPLLGFSLCLPWSVIFKYSESRRRAVSELLRSGII